MLSLFRNCETANRKQLYMGNLSNGNVRHLQQHRKPSDNDACAAGNSSNSSSSTTVSDTSVTVCVCAGVSGSGGTRNRLITSCQSAKIQNRTAKKCFENEYELGKSL